jgi:hypothetical protein
MDQATAAPIRPDLFVMPINARDVCAMSKVSPASSGSDTKMRSPGIIALAWGKIEVEGAGTFRDAKLFPGGAGEWDWRETGTEHTPGIQPTDVRELLDHGLRPSCCCRVCRSD